MVIAQCPVLYAMCSTMTTEYEKKGKEKGEKNNFNYSAGQDNNQFLNLVHLCESFTLLGSWVESELAMPTAYVSSH